ncbi:MAG: lamin tail domain-containing protein [Parcubacteria group bacterium]|jgi:hypothetical protein|nr:lamin tail domain-containing protein [Parcubacteria group bacterium]
MFKFLLFLITIFIFLFFPYHYSLASGEIIINEIMYDFLGSDDKHEWVEIKNISDKSIDLKGWYFYDGKNHLLNEPPKNGGQGSLIIPAYSYAILADDAVTFLTDYSNFSGIVIDTTMSLNNTSEKIQLIDNNKNIIDEVVYQKEMGGNENKGFSLERVDQFSNQFCQSNNVSGSPGKENDFNCNKEINLPTSQASLISEEKTEISEKTTDPDIIDIPDVLSSINSSAINSSIEKTTSTSTINQTSPIKVRILINEFIPNPSGSDAENEWIELYNDSDIDLNLKDWFLEDASGKKYIFDSEKINQKDYLILSSKDTKISLNNNGETLKIFSPNKELAFQISYEGTAKEGFSFARFGANDWRWTNILTPGDKNQFNDNPKVLDNKKEDVIIEGETTQNSNLPNSDLGQISSIENSSNVSSNKNKDEVMLMAIGLGLILSIGVAIFLKKILPPVSQNK